MLKPLFQDTERLDISLKDIPSEPGCYLMRDNNDRILYVGKSKDLLKRVRSYFRRSESHSPRIQLMIRQIYEIEFIVTDNEIEALTLESNLIKNNQPYFNILLKDDKKYPYLCITWSELYPRLFITRNRLNKNPKDRYYGPYVDVNLLRKTIFLVKSVFPLRQRLRPLYKDRTCLNYSIKRCPGVCQEKITPDEYIETLKKVEMIFQGRSNELKTLLEKKMNNYSDKQEYEKALLIRDQIRGVENIGESQKMTLPDSSISRDIIAIETDTKISSIQLFQMRAGKLVGRLGYIAKSSGESTNSILQKILEQHYSNIDKVEIPSELLIQHRLPQQELISDWLSSIKGKKVKISNPIRTKKAEIIELVHKNAKYELNRIKTDQHNKTRALQELAEILEISDYPRRIEGYDISHIQGSDAVASQVVFIDGVPAKQHYRKYKIKNEEIKIGHSDDFKSIAEVIRRRFKRWASFKLNGGNINELKSKKISLFDSLSISDWPDLIMIDGGKGQLNAAINVLKELNLAEDIHICSLAKNKEEIFIPYQSNSLDTKPNDPSVLILRRLRDESHRFAISYHKSKRSKRMIKSELSMIGGLGPKRTNQLLKHFKSVEGIEHATQDEISRVTGLGYKISQDIWEYFHK